ncbi:MAG: hypothetical protein KDJ16_02595 [Hyphomicrobiales bacterium]|nr:hypothetical protein [Hyphomicrobiales bacterium]
MKRKDATGVSRRKVLQGLGASALPFALAIPSKAKSAVVTKEEMAPFHAREDEFAREIEQKLAQTTGPWIGGGGGGHQTNPGHYTKKRERGTSCYEYFSTQNGGDYEPQQIGDDTEDYYTVDTW